MNIENLSLLIDQLPNFGMMAGKITLDLHSFISAEFDITMQWRADITMFHSPNEKHMRVIHPDGLRLSVPCTMNRKELSLTGDAGKVLVYGKIRDASQAFKAKLESYRENLPENEWQAAIDLIERMESFEGFFHEKTARETDPQ